MSQLRCDRGRALPSVAMFISSRKAPSSAAPIGVNLGGYHVRGCDLRRASMPLLPGAGREPSPARAGASAGASRFASGRLMAGHVGEQVETGRIGSLEIVEDQHQRLAGCQCGKVPPNRFEETQARLGRGQRRRSDRVPEAGGEIRVDRRQDERARTDVGHYLFDGRLPDPGPKGFQEGQVGRHRLDFRGASLQHTGTGGGKPIGDDGQEMALADPWISHAQGDPKPAARGIRERGADRFPGRLASNQLGRRWAHADQCQRSPPHAEVWSSHGRRQRDRPQAPRQGEDSRPQGDGWQCGQLTGRGLPDARRCSPPICAR